MLHLIQNLTDRFIDFLNHDPVRPHIPHNERVGNNKDVFVLRKTDDEAQAITCVSYQNSIPTSEGELFESGTSEPDVAVFYTIWSYAPGAGRQLIFDAVNHIKETRPSVKTFVTLSPKTEMARKFHLKNGAIVYRENTETTNYRYLE